MEWYDYNKDEKKPDKPFDPFLKVWEVKHCEVFDKCLDECADCIFHVIYHTNPQPWAEKEEEEDS